MSDPFPPGSQVAPPAPASGRPTAVPGRVLLLGAALIPLTIYWLHQLEIVWYTSQPTTISLYFHVIFSLLALMGLNSLLRRLRPGWALQRSELLVIYIMLAISSSLAGHDQLEILVPMLGESTWFATKENHWQQLFDGYLPNWLVVRDQVALRGFYEGNAPLLARAHLSPWLIPLGAWTGFTLVLFITMLCLNIILRKQWTERERLSYPIAQIPLEITDPRATMWRSRLFWLAFGLALAVDTLNGLAFIFPSLPAVPTHPRWLNFASWPWTATGGFTVAFYPFAIGLGYLLPLDLLFSSWFFYWFWKLQYLLTAVLGFGHRPNFPYVVERPSAAIWGSACSRCTWGGATSREWRARLSRATPK